MTHENHEPRYVGVLVQTDAGLEIFVPEAVELDATGVARSLMPGTAYLPTTGPEMAEWAHENVVVAPAGEDGEGFTVRYPNLDIEVTSKTYGRED